MVCTVACSRVCSSQTGIIRKYHIFMCRQCFRDHAELIGFRKVRRAASASIALAGRGALVLRRSATVDAGGSPHPRRLRGCGNVGTGAGGASVALVRKGPAKHDSLS